MKKNLLTTALIISAMFGVGCAKEKSSTEASTAQPIIPAGSGIIPSAGTTTRSGSATSTAGSTAIFEIASDKVFREYLGRTPSNPHDFKLRVNLIDSGDEDASRFSGTISIMYTDNGEVHASAQEVQSGFADATRFAGTRNEEFNQFFTANVDGEDVEVFHGFFQDKMGSVILVVDDVFAAGDGGGTEILSGRVYFKNFATTPAAQPNTYCWFIELGPYSCRAFVPNGAHKTATINGETYSYVEGGSIQTTSSLYPEAGSGYQLLGSFTGLNRAKAFKQ